MRISDLSLLQVDTASPLLISYSDRGLAADAFHSVPHCGTSERERAQSHFAETRTRWPSLNLTRAPRRPIFRWRACCSF